MEGVDVSGVCYARIHPNFSVVSTSTQNSRLRHFSAIRTFEEME